jgi:hypothetical protein
MNRILFLTLVVFAFLCTVAQAGLLTIDVIALEGTGYQVADSGKTVIPMEPGTTINFKVTATISGSTSPSTDSLQSVWGGFVQTLLPGYMFAGDMAFGAYTTTFSTLAASQVANVDLNADGYKDVGLQNPSASSSNPGYFQARASALQLGHVFDLGTFKLTDTHASVFDFIYGGVLVTDSTINYVKPIPFMGAYSFKVDNTVRNGLAAGGWPLVSIGTPVSLKHYIPEPSTLIMLGMGTISLLAYAWRRSRN